MYRKGRILTIANKVVGKKEMGIPWPPRKILAAQNVESRVFKFVSQKVNIPMHRLVVNTTKILSIAANTANPRLRPAEKTK